jgi:hypothetical protein
MFWLSDVQRLLGGDVWPRVPLAAGATRLGGDALLLVGLVLISRATRAGATSVVASTRPSSPRRSPSTRCCCSRRWLSSPP